MVYQTVGKTFVLRGKNNYHKESVAKLFAGSRNQIESREMCMAVVLPTVDLAFTHTLLTIGRIRGEERSRLRGIGCRGSAGRKERKEEVGLKENMEGKERLGSWRRGGEGNIREVWELKEEEEEGCVTF